MESQRLEHALDITIGALKDENRKNRAFKLIRGKISQKGYDRLSEKYNYSNKGKVDKTSSLKGFMKRISKSIWNFNYLRMLKIVANIMGFAILWGLIYLISAVSSQFFLGMPIKDIFEYYSDIGAVLTTASLGISIILFGLIKNHLNMRKLRKFKSTSS